jgi:hypothetical protein
MVERKYGHIVALCSLSGVVSIPLAIAYRLFENKTYNTLDANIEKDYFNSTSKFGVTGFMSALYDELCVKEYDNFIKTTTYFPVFVNTSDELVKIIGNNPIYSTKTAAKTLIKGMLLDERNVFLPSYAKSSGIIKCVLYLFKHLKNFVNY